MQRGSSLGPPGGRRSTLAAAPCGPLAFPPCRWETRALAPCPVTCGGGQVPLAVRCVRMERGRLISLPHSKCWPAPRPRPLEDCSPEPCPARSASLRRPVVLGRHPCRVASSCPKPCVLTRRRGSYWCREDRGGGLECCRHLRLVARFSSLALYWASLPGCCAVTGGPCR